MTDIDELETKPVFVVWTNTDLTEGRGHQIPIRVCWSRATARRIAKGQGVMGSDATVEEHKAYRIGRHWHAPCQIIAPSKDDEAQDKVDAEKNKAIEKAKAAGLSDEDIAALRR